MGTNRKTTPRRGTTLGDSDADRWLRGEPCGFFEFKPDDELAPLWLAHGDDEKFFWRSGMDSMPISLETLERYENAWLGTGPGSEYGGSAFFVFKNYTDAEQRKLWDSRGDKDLFRWKPGMYRPQPLAG